jgi:hypothetical protein
MSAISDTILGAVFKVIDRVIPDKAGQDAAKLKVLEMENAKELELLKADTALATGQLAVNQAEAANPSPFVAGWRPMVGWMGAFGFGYTVILQPLLPWLLRAMGAEDLPPLPKLDDDTLLYTLGGMLGFGGFRMMEKFKGVAAK